MKTRNGEAIDYKYNLSEYFGFLKNYKFLVGLLIFIVLLNEIKQIVDRYLLKIVIDNGTNFSSGKLAMNEFTSILIVAAVVYIAVMSFNLLVSWFKLHFLNRLDAATIYDLKQKYFSHILDLDHNFHTTHKTGSLISRLNRGSSAMERMNDSILFEFAPLVLQLFVAITALFYLDSISALIIFGVMAVFISFSFIKQRHSEESNLIANKSEDIEKGNVADFFTNIDSIRHYGKESYIKLKYQSLIKKTQENLLKNWDHFRATSAGQSLILGIGTFLLIFFSINKFLNGEITLGTVAFIYTTYMGLFGPLFGFVHGMRNASRAMADFQELFEYGKIEREIKDEPNAKKLKIQRGEIELRNISFKYGKREIFKNFNLKLEPQEKIALVGHSGCGKTTLIKLLYRLYDVDCGGVFLDGKNIKGFKQESLRSEMSIVPQECILFDDSIFNNIKFSNPNASKEGVMNAIKFAQLDKIIKTFPDKEDTLVGERGVKLSGGEKQRVSIARAILADKKILVLDEATSSLDSETEHEIQKDLKKLLEGRTSIIIAHRLSTIMNADRIIVMQSGKIVQIGKHSDLIRQPGEYKKLWSLQKGGYIK